ncbi:hypothetical protein [Eudoraea chungangensis]|uniref:hypothetical protein n=1 Tax=Eudoraea chungangensis TaxID=1481905 RepID=UPI0023EC877F|nr:hypothetical protein [Eudoraea chungangensis]
MKQINLNIARTLLIIGLIVGLKSWWQTFSHIGDESYILIPEFTKGKYHAWYHAFREAVGDLSAMLILLVLFFGKKSWRTPNSWWIGLILIIGYYAPFWIGTPFVPELAAPHMTAEMIHLGMAIPPIIGLFLAKKYFFNGI